MCFLFLSDSGRRGLRSGGIEPGRGNGSTGQKEDERTAIVSDPGEGQEKDGDPDGSGRKFVDEACDWSGTESDCVDA